MRCQTIGSGLREVRAHSWDRGNNELILVDMSSFLNAAEVLRSIALSPSPQSSQKWMNSEHVVGSG